MVLTCAKFFKISFPFFQGVSLSATRAGMAKNVKEGAPVLMVQNAITLLANVIVLQDGRYNYTVSFFCLNVWHLFLTDKSNSVFSLRFSSAGNRQFLTSNF